MIYVGLPEECMANSHKVNLCKSQVSHCKRRATGSCHINRYIEHTTLSCPTNMFMQPKSMYSSKCPVSNFWLSTGNTKKSLHCIFQLPSQISGNDTYTAQSGHQQLHLSPQVSRRLPAAFNSVLHIQLYFISKCIGI